MDSIHLPDAEYEVMESVWQHTGNVTSAMVAEDLSRKWKPQTLLTLMSRLCAKGFLSSAKTDGREKVFTPLISREEYLRSETLSFCNEVHGGSVSSLLTAFTDEKISEEEIEELSSLLQAWKKRSEEK